MIPILYDSYEIAFTSNGLGRLAECTRCVVTEERNGIYECEFDYPVDGEMFDLIREGRIIAVTHDDAHDVQPFDIYGRSAVLGNVVTFYAHHISYRLNNVILRPFTASSCAEAMTKLESCTFNTNPFTFWTDKTTSADMSNTVPTSVRAKLAGTTGSILDVYGSGEYMYDKFLVRLYASRGNDNGVSIRYGVNLLSLDQTYDESSHYTAVAPYWQSAEDGTVVMLPEGYVVYSGAGLHGEPWTDENGNVMEDGRGNIIYFNLPEVLPVPLDLTDAFTEEPTVAQLRAEALRRLNSSNGWLPEENIKVNFVDLSHTTEYANVSALQRVQLCDRVSVYCGPLGVNAVSMQVVKVVYNTLTEMYDEIEIGKAKRSYADTILDGVNSAIQAATEQMATTSELQKAIDSATEQITGAKGGHLLDIYDSNGKRQEMVIMDTDDVETATKVWRWNSGGLGYSSNGYAGPYALAMTADGAIVADFITTGDLSANRIKGGILTLGGDNNTRGALSIQDSLGSEIGRWNYDGLAASKIKFKIHANQSEFMMYNGRADATEYNQYMHIEPTIIELINGSSKVSINGLYDYITLTNNGVTSQYAYNYCNVSGWLTVTGTKSRVVSTDQYSDRLLYCYETPSPMFGDVGEGVIGEDGLCYVSLDPVFAQTIATNQYQVFLQRYGPGECYVADRKSGWFVVSGTPGMAFGWEIKAKQRDYDQRRLDRNDSPFTVPAQTYGEDAAQHIDDIKKARKSA